MNEWTRDYNGSYGTSANSSNVSANGSPFRHSSSSLAHPGTPNKVRTESNASSSSNAPGDSFISFNAKSVGGLTSALARANLAALDQQAVQMASSSSRESSAAHSTRSFSNAASDFNNLDTRPPFVRQSFSDGAPIDISHAHESRQQQNIASSTGEQINIPVSLPTTGPLSASDPRTQLYVSNLPYRVRWQDLKDLFRRAGTVLRADVSLTSDNRSRGFGTVLLATEDDACRACDMFKGFNWQGRTLDVKIDRSGTLLGVGVGQADPANLSSGNLFLNESSDSTSVAPHSPLPQPVNNLIGVLGNASPTPSPLGTNTGQASGPSPSLNAVHTNSPVRAMPALQQQYGFQPYANLAQHGVGNNLPAGLSPALLPFLGSSSRSSIPSPSQSSYSFTGHQSPIPWLNQNTPQTYLQQQRSASISAGMSNTMNYGNQMMNSSGNPSLINGNAALMQSGHPSPLYGQQNIHARMMSPISPAIQGNRSTNPSMNLPQAPLNLMPGTNSTYFGRVLFVGNLPFQCQWQDLKDLFRAAGNIQRADVALTAEGKSRGFGTVLFASPEDAQNAVRIYHGYEYSGRTLKVHFDRFAQATIPATGALPASPSQYTGAFAAANTPMPVSNAASQQASQQNSQHMQVASMPIPQQQQQHQQRSPFFSQPYRPITHGYEISSPHRDASGAMQTNLGQAYAQQNHVHGALLPNDSQSKDAEQSIQEASLADRAIKHNSPFPSMFSIPSTQANFNTISTSINPSTDLARYGDDDQSEKQGLFETTSSSAPRDALNQPEASATSTQQRNLVQQADERNPDEQENAKSKGVPRTPSNIGQNRRDGPVQNGGAHLDSQSRRLSRAPVGSGAHPGRIALPPQALTVSNTVLPPYSPMHHRMSVPMTPGMPGFTFHAVPETPPVHHQFLSPGLGGPFSPPLASPTYLGPATPGAPAIRPIGGHGPIGNINPAPGAPIHFNNGASTPMAGMMQTLQNRSNFNPMFPPIGMNYQANPMPVNQYIAGSDLPQTPHWSQPRPPPPPQNATFSKHDHRQNSQQIPHSSVDEKREGEKNKADLGDSESKGNISDVQLGSSKDAGGYPFPSLDSTSAKSTEKNGREAIDIAEGDLTDEENEKSKANGISVQKPVSNLDLRDIQDTEELARKIAQMSAQKALRMQQRDRVGSSSAALPSASSSTSREPQESFRTSKIKPSLQLDEKKASGRRSLPEMEAGLNLKDRKEDLGQDHNLFAAMSGSALDDSVSSVGSANSAQGTFKFSKE